MHTFELLVSNDHSPRIACAHCGCEDLGVRQERVGYCQHTRVIRERENL
jgi:hypothetical protein